MENQQNRRWNKRTANHGESWGAEGVKDTSGFFEVKAEYQ